MESFGIIWHHLRSAQTRQLVVPRTRTKYGDRSFAVQGPRVWDSLPVELRAPDISLTVFRNKLKTHLFDITGTTRLRHHFLVALRLANL